MGSVFLSQLRQLHNSHPSGSKISLVLISRSNKSLRAESIDKPLSLETWSEDLAKSSSPALQPSELIDWLRSYPAGRCVVVDNTSSQFVADAYPAFLKAGFSVTTPNKKAFSSTQDLWDGMLSAAFQPATNPKGGLLYHESSVGAGMPVISTMKDLVETGDRVKRIEGVMSGSLSFLFNSFMPLDASGDDKASKWSANVLKAKELGYTEPDPRDDLSGLDVARKLVILARVGGMRVQSTDSFPVQSLIPRELEHVGSGDEFLARLPEFDGEMEKLKNEARAKGKVLRFVGTVDFERGDLKVAVESIGPESPLAGLIGNANVFSFYTERYEESPLVIQGAGYVIHQGH